MYDKITLPVLITLLSEKTGKSKKLCEDFLRELFATLVNVLGEGENVKIKGIGTFKVVDVEPRKSVNVNTGEDMEIPGHRKITFTPAKEMAEDVNSPFAMFESVEINDEASEDTDVREAPEIEEVEDIIPLKSEEVVTPIKKEEEEEEVEAPSEVESETSLPEEEIEMPEEIIEGPSEDAVKELYEVPSEDAEEELFEEPKPRKKKLNFLWGFLCGLFCTAILVAVGYIFLADKFNAMMGSVQDAEPATEITPIMAEPVPASTQNAADSDSLVSGTSEADAVIENAAPTKPSDEIVYDTISKTRYLTTMAKAHYGNYNLWPIIYEENKAMLGHPDRIRPGTRVVIPSLSKYGVNPNNPEDIAKAKNKGVEIYARFNK